MDNIVKTVGLDLAKNSFHVFCADREGRLVESKALRRGEVLPYFAKLAPCVVPMETCTGANWWCRQIKEQGHDARLIPAAYVKPYVKSQKNDALDAEAICEAAQRPNMRYAPLKSESASALLTMHRTRCALIKQRTMSRNHVRAACAEFGLVERPGTKGFERLASKLKEDGDDLPSTLRESQRQVLASIDRLTESAADLHARICAWHRECEASQRLEQIPGVGVLTATYLAAVLGDGSAYRNGRQFSASLGLVPRQLSTGGKQKLGGITKKGDWTLRSLLCEGAISVLRHRLRDSGRHFPGTTRRLEQKSMKSVAVELANRNARTAWAMIRHGADSDPARQHLAKEPMALAA